MVSEAQAGAALLAILRELTETDNLTAEPATRLDTLPGWDSIHQIEAIALAEENLDVMLHTRDLDKIFTFSDFVTALVRATPAR